MKKEIQDKIIEISKQTIYKWCKDTFEGEMVEVLGNACNVMAVNQVIPYIDPTKDLPEIEKIAKESVITHIKNYVNENF